jgi:hypothetical protein
MSPFEAIEAHYAAEGVDFAQVVSNCQKLGFCVNTDDYFLMAVPVCRASVRPLRKFGILAIARREHADCWFIAGMSGDMEKAWSAEPYPLPWFAFERGKRLHIWRRERIMALTLRHGATIPA